MRSVDGSFPSGPAFRIRKDAHGQAGLEEGNTIQYTWMVSQDLGGLIDAMGADATAIGRLHTLCARLNAGPNEPYYYYWTGNESNLDMPWAYLGM